MAGNLLGFGGIRFEVVDRTASVADNTIATTVGAGTKELFWGEAAFTTSETFGWEFTVLQRVFKFLASVAREGSTSVWFESYMKVEGMCDFGEFVGVWVWGGDKNSRGGSSLFPKIAYGVDNSVLKDYIFFDWFLRDARRKVFYEKKIRICPS